MMKKKLLLFDFDGTIADTLYLGYQIQSDFADDYNLTKVEKSEIKDLRELSSHDVLKRLGISIVKLPFLAVKFQRELSNRINELKPIKDMIDTLKKINKLGLQMGIITSNSEENVTTFLDNYGIRDLFSFIHSERNIFGKSRVLKKTIKEHFVTNNEVVYVGDETRDVDASLKADVPIIAVGWGFNSKKALQKHQPNYFASTPDELYERIKRLI